MKLRILVIVSTFFLIAQGALAQFGFRDYLQNAPGGAYTTTWFFNVLENLTCYFIQFAIVAFGIMLVVYGLMFFQGRGSPQGMADAKKALTWGLVGGLVIMGVFTIILSVASVLNVNYPILSMISCS